MCRVGLLAGSGRVPSCPAFVPEVRLVAENAALRAENAELRAKHDELTRMVAVLTERVAELERRLAADSSNSRVHPPRCAVGGEAVVADQVRSQAR